MTIPFTSSDVWLFISIGFAEKNPPGDLSNVFFAGDAINKAIFSPQELRRGLAKLTKAGYVDDSKDLYSLTETGRELFDRVGKPGRTWMSIWKDLEKELRATSGPTDDPRYEDPRFPYPGLTDEMIEAALAEYRRRFAAMLAEIRRQENGSGKK